MSKTINALINKQKNDLKVIGAPDRQWSTFDDLKKNGRVCKYEATILRYFS